MFRVEYGGTLKMKAEKWIFPTCWLCGKKFKCIIDLKTKMIKTECFHSWLNTRYFNWWAYDWVKENKFTPIFKHPFYRIIGFCKPMREIIYRIWRIFYFKKDEYWECPKCYKEK